jgi:very-short-patch-repair endonuclease
MAAVLACGDGAVLSHDSAAELWGVRPRRRGPIEISAPTCHRRAGIVVYRRRSIEATRRSGIPVGSITQTLIDLAPRLPRNRLERAINEADVLGLTDPERLRCAIEDHGPAAAALKRVLDRRTFRLARSDLERLFIPIALRAGLSLPQTRAEVNGYEVDFWWPDLGLIVESDGLRYHRTPAKLAADRLRDQTHTAAGLTCMRFTDEQIAFDQPHVERTLRAVASRLRPLPYAAERP